VLAQVPGQAIEFQVARLDACRELRGRARSAPAIADLLEGIGGAIKCLAWTPFGSAWIEVRKIVECHLRGTACIRRACRAPRASCGLDQGFQSIAQLRGWCEELHGGSAGVYMDHLSLQDERLSAESEVQLHLDKGAQLCVASALHIGPAARNIANELATEDLSLRKTETQSLTHWLGSPRECD